MLIMALIVLLAMLRLGVWQLQRADDKRQVLSQRVSKSEQAPVDLLSIVDDIKINQDRFRQVIAQGAYEAHKSIYIDNQVVNGQVGYQIFTPITLASGQVVLVGRGWLPVGDSRDVLPRFDTPTETQQLVGRLNVPMAQPPLWDDSYKVNDGAVWQYLPIDEYARQMQLNVLPLVLELAPEDASSEKVIEAPFVRKWAAINDEWVAKHQGYAFQWFAMAAAFFIACVVLLFRQFSTKDD